MKKFKDLLAYKEGDQHLVVIISSQQFMRGIDYRGGKLTLFLGAKFNSIYAQR